MSFKIKRFSEKESYKITCDWINDFANGLEKNANFVDRVRKRNSVEKFSTIEEKMNDIKSRVGYLDFDASKDQILKTESDNSIVSNACGCNKCEACEAKSSKKEMLRSILMEMIKIIDGRKDINYPEEVLNECRKDQYMNFSNLESELDPEYLKGWLAEKIKARRSEMKKPEAIRPSYEEAHQFAIEDSVPSYYNAKGEL
jgi:hypothetical protein